MQIAYDQNRHIQLNDRVKQLLIYGIGRFCITTSFSGDTAHLLIPATPPPHLKPLFAAQAALLFCLQNHLCLQERIADNFLSEQYGEGKHVAQLLAFVACKKFTYSDSNLPIIIGAATIYLSGMPCLDDAALDVKALLIS